MKKIKIIALLILTCMMYQNLFAQFLKNYTDPTNPNASVSFECITEKMDTSGNFYIAGHIGDTITIFKMSTSGIVLNTYKIKASPANTKLDAIMIDASGLIVVLGNIQTSGANEGIMFQLTPLGVVQWFRQTNAADRIVYWDMSDKSGSSYIVSGERGTDGSALILKINKTNGGPTVANNYIVAGLEDPEAIQFSGSKMYATGRYALPGGQPSGNGFRFCFSRFTASSFTHLGTYYYIAPKYPTATARTYSNDILVNGNSAIMVGSGDDNNTADPFKNLHITKVNVNNGIPAWSNKYDDPSAVSDGALTEIRLDNAGNYTVMGFAINPNTSALDKAKLWSVNPSNGNLKWNRQYELYRRTASVGSSYEYGFTVIGNYIYAVGQNSTSGITKGVLLKVNAADGNVSGVDGTRCFDTLTINKSPYTFYDSIPVTILPKPVIPTTKPKKKVVTIKMNDSLVCGEASNCNCQFSVLVDGGGTPHPNCGDTIKQMPCGIRYYFTPHLTCDSTNPVTNTISVSVIDAFNNPAPWAAGFTGTGNLTIPTGISGVYTLTYYWGSNGSICDSCKYYLDIACCDTTCTLSGSIKMLPFGSLAEFVCGQTANVSCKNDYVITQTLHCTNSTSTQLTAAVIKDPAGNIPSWASTFMANLGNGTLSIPGGISSGTYTLTYYWGLNGVPCDSCKMYLKITCCTNFTGTAGPDILLYSCCGGAQLNASASGGIPPYTYSWSPATGLSNPNIQNPICTSLGTYTVTIKDAYGCTVTDQAVAAAGSGHGSCCRKSPVAEGKATAITVSPNPTTNSFKIAGLNNKTASLDIFNFQGIKVAHYQNVTDGNSFGAALPRGVYMLRFQFKDGITQNLQLIKN